MQNCGTLRERNFWTPKRVFLLGHGINMCFKPIWGHFVSTLFFLHKRINNIHIPLDLQLQLCDSTVLPSLLYGYETWVS